MPTARERMEVALKRSEERGHTASIAFALIFAAGLYQRANDPVMTAMYAERTIEYSRTHGFAQWVAVGTLYEGWAMFSLGHREKGVALARAGVRGHVEGRHDSTALCHLAGRSGRVGRRSERRAGAGDRTARTERTAWASWSGRRRCTGSKAACSRWRPGRSGRVFRAGHFTCAASSRAIPGIASGS